MLARLACASETGMERFFARGNLTHGRAATDQLCIIWGCGGGIVAKGEGMFFARDGPLCWCETMKPLVNRIEPRGVRAE